MMVTVKSKWTVTRSSRIGMVVIAVLAVVQPVPVFGAGGAANTAGQDAAKLYEHGVHAAEKEDYVSALEAFEKAYATQPTYQVLYNIALAYAALNRPALAVEHFERYLSEGGSGIESNRVSAVRELIAEQKRLYGVIELHVRPVPSKVSVDGKEVGEGTLQVAPGMHLIRFELSGYETSEVRAVVLGGDKVDIVETLTQLRLPVPKPHVEARAATDTRGVMALQEHPRQDISGRQIASDDSSILTFGLLGLGAAVAAAGGGLLYYNTVRNEKWVSGGRDEFQRVELEASVKATDTLGYAMLGLGGAAVVGGGWLYLTAAGSNESKTGYSLGWVTAF